MKGPTGCRYLADDRQANYVRDGWNYTGDAYLMDADGYFVYQARTDDMIISAGYNIGGPEVESALLRIRPSPSAASIGAPDDERGQIVKAFVVLRPGFAAGDAMTRELQDHVKREIAPYKYPRAIEYLASLPRTETGKLQRFRLRQLDEEGRRGNGMTNNRYVTTRRVGFAHCDPAGFVFYPRFFDLVHEAEEDWLREAIGWPFAHAVRELHLGLPIVKAEVDCHAPSRQGDVLEIAVSVADDRQRLAAAAVRVRVRRRSARERAPRRRADGPSHRAPGADRRRPARAPRALSRGRRHQDDGEDDASAATRGLGARERLRQRHRRLGPDRVRRRAGRLERTAAFRGRRLRRPGAAGARSTSSRCWPRPARAPSTSRG